MSLQAESSEEQRIAHLVHEIEMLRLKRKRGTQRHPQGKRFSQDELGNIAYPSYKNMLLGRTQRLPDRAALMQIADYLECSPIERNALLRAAQYAPESLPDLQRRKQATILMGSIFVSLPVSLDLEDAAHIMQTLWERVESIIVSHRGQVTERTGNILLALWSIETTHEDDPEQAIRAALSIQAEVKTLNAESRFGIHTGQVLLQTTGKYGQIQVSGEAVNIVSHLSHTSSDGILISPATYNHLRGIFDVLPVDTLPAYHVERIKPVAEPIMLQELDAPLIGRANELTYLQEAFQLVSNTHHEEIISIVAEAGIGKSRLLAEFDNWLNHNTAAIFSFKGRASQSSQEIPYSLLRSLLAFRFEIADDDLPEIVQQKIENGIAESDVENAQKAAHLIAHLLSFNFGDSPHVRGASSDAQEFFETALIHLSNYFRAIADNHVIVMLLEDIHWADDSSLIILKRLGDLLMPCPVLIVCTTRSEQSIAQLRPKTLELPPLSRQDSYELLDELLSSVESVPDTLREVIVNRSGGNPLFIEELVKMLTENGTLFREAEQWLTNHEHLTVPTTLTGVLQSRFDNLSAHQQLLLQIASVFGRVFWDGSVKSLLSNVQSDTLPFAALMDDLSSQKMIFRHRKSTFRGYAEFTFKHALLRDVIYDTILKQNRVSYHAAAANWLLTVASRNQRLDEYAGLIAYHFKCADLPNDAWLWYRRAGKAAAARFANTEALTYLTCALDLLPATNEVDRYALLASRERVQDALGFRAEQAADLDTMIMLARTMDNAYLQVETIVRQTNYAYLLGSSEEVARLAQEAIRLAQTIGANEYQASSYVMLGNVLWDQGDLEAADTCYEHALRLSSISG